jgi:hypothetical protein
MEFNCSYPAHIHVKDDHLICTNVLPVVTSSEKPDVPLDAVGALQRIGCYMVHQDGTKLMNIDPTQFACVQSAQTSAKPYLYQPSRSKASYIYDTTTMTWTEDLA